MANMCGGMSDNAFPVYASMESCIITKIMAHEFVARLEGLFRNNTYIFIDGQLLVRINSYKDSARVSLGKGK